MQLLERQGLALCGRDLSVCQKDPPDSPRKNSAKPDAAIIIVGNMSTTRRSRESSGWGHDGACCAVESIGGSRKISAAQIRKKSSVSWRRRHLTTINFKI